MEKFVKLNEFTRYKVEKEDITIEQLSWNKKDIKRIYINKDQLREILGESK